MDNLNPDHYKSHPSGIECIEITQHMDFLTGNAMKYLWRAGLKDNRIEDLKKAKWYIERLIDKEDNTVRNPVEPYGVNSCSRCHRESFCDATGMLWPTTPCDRYDEIRRDKER